MYHRLTSSGPIPVPNGGPFPWPAQPLQVSETRVPIPSGSTTVSFDWEYFNAESFQSVYNDGMAVALVDGSGNLILQFVYADNQLPLGTCVDTQTFGTEILPFGLQTVAAAPLPPLAGCEYISIVSWNEGDNAVASVAYVDNIQFNAVGPACPVPCFVVAAAPPSLVFTSPSGLGCVQVNLTNMPGGGFYFLGATVQAGTFPNGWFFGIDIGFAELQNEINTGFPFLGVVGASACGGTGSATIGEFCGVPSGVTFYAVGLGAPAGSSFPSAVTNAASYTIP
jgi:hypothetical protein